ncbi:alpha/beta fold hydrolase [Actinomycetospora straminea]|uniref:Alpha/beta hydrolase n=1 Tax=Actinomycetospora straminea TaxID=663607 RepID=A0ABP9EKF9_9PSEU|nr:alpha/beta hydrolase [Actinomycetospora straminea]MDD7933804.1 alpha/beta hydrolase [Actinomycetospora straminea]
MISRGAVPLHVNVYGGTGPAVLLLHGAGADSRSFDVLGPLLADRFRPVAVDLRGHGGSGAGPFTWDAVLDDLETVVDALELGSPAVVGHSVGGLVAGRWAGRHPDCPGAVSLDGHRQAGVDLAHHDPTGTGLDAQTLGLAAADYTTWFEQVFAGLEAQKPSTQAQASAAARALLRADDLRSFEEVTAPVLLVVAASSGPMTPPRWEPLMRAFRSGLRRDLLELARHRPNISVQEVDASHAVLAERPEETSRIVHSFLAASRQGVEGARGCVRTTPSRRRAVG